MLHVALHRHADGTGQSLEDTLDFVVFVLPFRLHVQVHPRCIAQTLEEMQEHLGGHFPYPFTVKLSLPYQPGASTEVECHLAETVVHRQAVAVAFNATLVAQSLEQTLTQGQCRVLNGVVLIDMKVPLAGHREVYVAVLGYLLQHVVEETQSRGDVTLAVTVEVHTDEDVRLAGSAPHLSLAFSSKDRLSYFIPSQVVPENE